MVAGSLDKSALFIGEAKWRERTDFNRAFYRLQENTEALTKQIGNKKVVYGIFAKEKPRRSVKGCHVITPKEILKALR